MANLNSHIKGDKIKWIIVLIVGVALIAAVIGLSVKLSRQTTTTTIGSEAYVIGVLDEDTGKLTEGDAAIYTRKGISVDGLTCVLVKDAEVEYQLFFYDAKGKFLEATELLSEDFNGEVPEDAETVKIMIVPTNDEDGKVSLTEVLGYAKQLKVTINR